LIFFHLGIKDRGGSKEVVLDDPRALLLLQKYDEDLLVLTVHFKQVFASWIISLFKVLGRQCNLELTSIGIIHSLDYKKHSLLMLVKYQIPV